MLTSQGNQWVTTVWCFQNTKHSGVSPEVWMNQGERCLLCMNSFSFYQLLLWLQHHLDSQNRKSEDALLPLAVLRKRPKYIFIYQAFKTFFRESRERTQVTRAIAYLNIVCTFYCKTWQSWLRNVFSAQTSLFFK